jgi:hypothetical protein
MTETPHMVRAAPGDPGSVRRSPNLAAAVAAETTDSRLNTISDRLGRIARRAAMSIMNAPCRQPPDADELRDE